MRLRPQAWITAVLFVAAALGQMVTAAGASPGANGRIAFATGHVELINADGTGRVTLDEASPASSVNEPAWNATGTKLAFRKGGSSISTMNANGDNVNPLVTMPSFAGNPTWSPDGSVVAFDGFIGGPNQENRIYTVPAAGGSATELVALDALDPTYSPDGTTIAYEESAGNSDIGVMNADGSNAANITSGASGNAGDYDPSWSPDGAKIAFTRTFQIWTMNADGSGAIQLTTGTDASHPTWSPDGTKIAFQRDDDIWVMDSDGSASANVTNTTNVDEKEPDWGICTGSGCPPQVKAPPDRTHPESFANRVALQIRLTRPASQPVTVQWAYRDGTATLADGDYEAEITSGSITIPAGQISSGDLPYTFIVLDDVTEPDEFYTLDLSGAITAPIADWQTVITIGSPSTAKCPGYELEPGNHVVGTEGDDEGPDAQLLGSSGRDVICGLGGDDVIAGSDGDDLLIGGDGKDDLYGGKGDDEMVGGRGNDRLYGHLGHNELLGGPGDDRLEGGSHDDELYGNVDNDFLWGGEGADVIHGGDGNDFIQGSFGSDTLYGNGGNDRLEGQRNPDKLYGQAGNDDLDGGSGLDGCSGGLGSDHLQSCERSKLPKPE